MLNYKLEKLLKNLMYVDVGESEKGAISPLSFRS